jgi:hypothetical protein
VIAQENLALYSKSYIGIKSDGSLALQSATGSWDGGSALKFTGGGIDFNGPAADSVSAPKNLTTTILDDTKFSSATGWEVNTDGLESIVTRAPTHEPYPYHNQGVSTSVKLAGPVPTPPPGTPPVPPGVKITKTV